MRFLFALLALFFSLVEANGSTSSFSVDTALNNLTFFCRENGDSNIPSVPDAAKKKLEFLYDYSGRLMQRKAYSWNTSTSSYELSGTTKFVYDGTACIAELNQNNTLSKSYVWGLDLSGSLRDVGGIGGLLQVNSITQGSHFVAFDGNGNVSKLIDSSNGQISAEYAYSPSGETIQATGSMAKLNPYRWSTKRVDSDSGEVFYEARVYVPSTGKWRTRDPIGELGGANPYAFVENDAINYVDRFGLDKIYGPDGVVYETNDYVSYHRVVPSPLGLRNLEDPTILNTFRLTGGLIEIGAGALYTYGTGGLGGWLGGGALIVNGTDNVIAGYRSLKSDSYKPAFLESAVYSVAGDGLLGTVTYSATQLGVGFTPAAISKLSSANMLTKLQGEGSFYPCLLKSESGFVDVGSGVHVTVDISKLHLPEAAKLPITNPSRLLTTSSGPNPWVGEIISEVTTKPISIERFAGNPKSPWIQLEGAGGTPSTLSISPFNTAERISTSVIPAGTRIQRGTAAPVPEWKGVGGAEQIQILDNEIWQNQMLWEVRPR